MKGILISDKDLSHVFLYLILGMGNLTCKSYGHKIRKALLIKEIEQLEDISLLRILKSMLHYGLKNEGRISIEQYNQELDEADAEIEMGEFLTHKDALKEIRSWREK